VTTSDVLQAVWRRWYVVFVALACIAAGVQYVATRPGVYLSQVTVRLLAPSTSQDNALVTSSESLIATAGIVERYLNADGGLAATASPKVTLTDRGIYRGTSITLPNAGGQFNYLFREPVLYVQAAGPTFESAVAARNDAVGRIRATVEELQDESYVPARQRIRTRVVVPTLAVSYLDGHPARAVLVVITLGLGLMLLACVLLDRRLLRRRPGTDVGDRPTTP
jgi:hypothetical protein